MDTLIYSYEKRALLRRSDGTPFLDPLSLVATVGGYDGVHLGHAWVIRSVVSEAQTQGLQSAVFTFDPSPASVLRPESQPPRIGSLEENLQQIARLGVDYTIVIPFSRSFSKLSAQTFLSEVLSHDCGVRTLFVGYDNRFGRNREESFDQYLAYAQALGMELKQLPPRADLDDPNLFISSTLIRKKILAGDVATANQWLGYPYSLEGRVVKGNQIGRTIDYPTANILIEDPHKLLPAFGVYAARATLEGTPYYGMLYIGMRPTIEGPKQQVVEVNFFDFDGDLYGKNIRIELHTYIRGEKTFASLQELKDEIARDEKQIRQFWNQNSHL